jgi:signal transduction histidine kinase/ligand-binding sensor domain-containing protein
MRKKREESGWDSAGRELSHFLPVEFRLVAGEVLLKFGVILILILPGLFDAPLVAQTKSAVDRQVGHDFWGFKDNAPQGTSSFAQTIDGFLWLGTPIGLYRFDGTRFELFHSPFGNELLSTNILALFAPPSGGLWIGYTFGGFSFLNDGRITNYGRELASPTGSVYSFAQNANGVLWAATTSGLWKFDRSHWQHLGPESNLPSGPIREARSDQDGTLWTLFGWQGAAQATKLAYLRPGSSQFQTAATDRHVLGFTLDADGKVVTSPESKQLFDKSRGDSGDLPSAYPVLRNGSLQIVDRAQSVWIIPQEPIVLRLVVSEGIADALNKASPRNSETYNLNPNTLAKLVDREGNIWFGEQNGVHRFFYSPLIRQELPKNEGSYFTVTADDQGAVWITAGGDNAKLFRVANDQVESRKFTGSGSVQFAYYGPDKTVWLGRANGLWRLVDGSWIRVDLPKEMVNQSAFLQTITQDHRGGMWVSFGRHGLYCLADGVWTSYGGREDLPKTGVVIEFTDSLGRVWFGYTKSQLAVLDGDHVQVFGPNDGIRVGNIASIYGRGSEIWIGGEFGLQQFDHGRFHNIQATDNELLRGISGIVETANGDLWLNGLGGIFHVGQSEIAEALKNPAYQVKGEHFGPREGLPGFPFQLRPLNTAIEGNDGRLWFATSGGVVWLDPARPEKNVLPPPITIQSVSADDKSYPLGSTLKFPAHTSSVQISYAAISLSDPAAVHFRYKLQESDKDWHEVASASPVSYRNLAPGYYHFSVAATDTNGVWSNRVATTEFAILPAFYQTRWFLVLCVAVTLTALYLLYLLRLRQVAHQFRVRMDERLNERTRIARELHDTLLQSFQGLLLRLLSVSNALPELPATAEAKHRLNSVIDLAEQAVTEGRDAVQGLRSSTILSSDFASALNALGAELATVGGDKSLPTFHVAVEGAPRELKPILRDEAYRIAGEALRNAFRHAQAHRVDVTIRYDEQQLAVRVHDDGKGIDPETLAAKGRAGHWGLRGMRERASKIGAKLELGSQPGAGTEMELKIPGATAYQSRRAWGNWFSSWGSSDIDIQS